MWLLLPYDPVLVELFLNLSCRHTIAEERAFNCFGLFKTNVRVEPFASTSTWKRRAKKRLVIFWRIESEELADETYKEKDTDPKEGNTSDNRINYYKEQHSIVWPQKHLKPILRILEPYTLKDDTKTEPNPLMVAIK